MLEWSELSPFLQLERMYRKNWPLEPVRIPVWWDELCSELYCRSSLSSARRSICIQQYLYSLVRPLSPMSCMPVVHSTLPPYPLSTLANWGSASCQPNFLGSSPPSIPIMVNIASPDISSFKTGSCIPFGIALVGNPVVNYPDWRLQMYWLGCFSHREQHISGKVWLMGFGTSTICLVSWETASLFCVKVTFGCTRVALVKRQPQDNLGLLSPWK